MALAGAQAQDPAGPRRPWDLDVGLARVGVGLLYAPHELHCVTHMPLKRMRAARRRVFQPRGSEAWLPWRPARLCLGPSRGGQPWQSSGATASPASCISLSLSLPAPTALGALEAAPILGLRWTGLLVVARRWWRPGSWSGLGGVSCPFAPPEMLPGHMWAPLPCFGPSGRRCPCRSCSHSPRPLGLERGSKEGPSDPLPPSQRPAQPSVASFHASLPLPVF